MIPAKWATPCIWIMALPQEPGLTVLRLMHQALGTTAQGAVRFSFSHFNTEEEIQTGIEAVRELAE